MRYSVLSHYGVERIENSNAYDEGIKVNGIVAYTVSYISDCKFK